MDFGKMKNLVKKIPLFALALVFAVSVFAFAACGNKEEEKTGDQQTLDISDVSWTYRESDKYGVAYYQTRNVWYCSNPVTPNYQTMNIYVPAAYMNADGSLIPGGRCGDFTTETAPIIFVNTVGGYNGYMAYEITATTADDNYIPYLGEGCVVALMGERGKNTTGSDGSTGQAPIGLVDLKAGIRYLRHNGDRMAGDTDRIISVGTSAGGAMSTLLGVTGNSHEFDAYLEEMGAFMDETDDVYAVQAYCPVTDLDHADMAYEWMFDLDYYEDNITETQPTANYFSSDFDRAMSHTLAEGYVDYVNGMGLRDIDGTALTLDAGGRSGTLYDYVIGKLEDAATIFLSDMTESERQNYLSGGTGKYVSGWLSYSGGKADITCGDCTSEMEAIIYSAYRTRYKDVCAFDSLDCTTGENNEFGQGSILDYRHFSKSTTEAIGSLRDEFPEEYETYYEAYRADAYSEEVERNVYLLNPFNFIGDADTPDAEHFRIRLGSADADTSYLISATLALTLQGEGLDVDYGFVWDEPHTNADRPGEFMAWVKSIM